MTKKTFLDLGKQPIANKFTKSKEEEEYLFDLKVVFDEETKLVSLEKFVDLEMMFNDEYVYLSSASKTMREHFKNTAENIKKNFQTDKVLEIGSNDGVFLKNFTTTQAMSVEPCTNFGDITRKLGYKTYDNFWNKDLVEEMKSNNEKFDLIFSANCMCHIPEIEDAFRNISEVLESEGVFIFEDPSLLQMIKRNSYDQIYDEHAHIFSVTSLSKILEKAGLEIFKVEDIEIHGGSNRIYAKKKESQREIEPSVEKAFLDEDYENLNDFATYVAFAKRLKKSKDDLLKVLKTFKDQGKKIISYGATSKSTTVFNYCNINENLIEYIVDNTPDKQGKYAPGSKIPVVSDTEGFDKSVDVAFLGAWNFKDEIVKKEKDFLSRGGVFITHVPFVSEVK